MNKYDKQELDAYMTIFTEWIITRIINTVIDKQPEFKHSPSKYKIYDGGKIWHETKMK